MEAKELAQKWLDLFETRTSTPFNNRKFMIEFNRIDAECRGLSEEDMAEFKAIIHKRMKQILRENGEQYA
jgi:hypothetical protein